MTVLQQSGVGLTTPGTDSTTTVRDIATCVSLDTRKVIDPNNPNVGAGDTNLLVDYTNRISLDLLRHSRYTFLIAGPVTFTTTASVQGSGVVNNQYWVGLSGMNPVGTIDTGLNLNDFDSIKRDTVIDYSNFKRLASSELQPVSQEFTLPAKPRIWQVLSDVPNVITLWPPPDGAYQISFRYYQERNILTNLGQVIQIPDRYKDIVCHGVTWLTYQYLKSYPEDVQAYKELYLAGKTQIIKDMNLFPRGEEFVRPDPSAVTRQTTTGIGLDSGLETSIP